MSIGLYVILCSGVFVLDLALLGAYFTFVERNSFLEISDTVKIGAMKNAGVIQAVLFVLTSLALFFLSGDKKWFEENNFLTLCALIAGFGVIGLNASEKKISLAAAALLQLAGIAAAVLLFPSGTVFFHMGLPPVVDNAAAVVLWFVYFRLLFVMDRLEGFTQENSICVGTVCFLGLFISAELPPDFLRFGGLLLPVMMPLFPFYFLGCHLPMRGVARNIFCFFVGWVSFYLASKGAWGVGVLLAAYPLFEGIVFTCRFLKGLLTKNKPAFLFDTLLNRGIEPFTVVKFIFRRNVIICALALLSFSASLQYQPVILAALFLLDFYIRVVSPSQGTPSLRSLFREMRENTRKEISETGKAFNAIKEKYSEKKDDKE